MSLDAKELGRLRRIASIVEKLIAEAPRPHRGRPSMNKKNGSGKRIRRTGKVLVQFRKMLKAERRKGVPVAQLARKHGISTAYIYSL